MRLHSSVSDLPIFFDSWMEIEEAEDMISELPDNVLHCILAFLPLLQKAQTSVLSRRWKYLWLSTPALDFAPDLSVMYSNPLRFIHLVDHCLLFSSTNLGHLRLDLSLANLPGQVLLLDRWIHLAGERSITELELRLSSRVSAPSSLFRCRTLLTLKLSCYMMDLPPLPCSELVFFCTNLKRIQLHDLAISEETASALLGSCKNLEHLILTDCYMFERLEISDKHSRLQVLALMNRGANSWIRLTVAAAPRLHTVMFSGDPSCLSLQNVPSLTRLLLSANQIVGTIDYDFTDFAHVEILSVQYWFWAFYQSQGLRNASVVNPKEVVFKNLKEIHCCYHPIHEHELPFLLRSTAQHCPSLETICLRLVPDEINIMQDEGFPTCVFYSDDDEDEHTSYESCDPLKSAGQALNHIRTIMLAGFKCSEPMLQLLRALLINSSSCLESLILYIASGDAVAQELLLHDLFEEFRDCSKASLICKQVPEGEASCLRHSHLFGKWLEFGKNYPIDMLLL